MSVFTTHPCVICGALIRWDDEVCSDQCEVELDRRREGSGTEDPWASRHDSPFSEVGPGGEDFYDGTDGWGEPVGSTTRTEDR